MLEIFPNHISDIQIKGLYRLYPVTILQRNLLDSFISAQKAGKTEKYEKASPTDMKIKSNAVNLNRFAKTI